MKLPCHIHTSDITNRSPIS